MSSEHSEPPYSIATIRLSIVPKLLFAVGAFCVALISLYFFLNTPPSGFPTHTEIIVDDGASIRAVAESFQHNSLVRSSTIFSLMLRTFFAKSTIQSGVYTFDRSYTSYDLASALITGEHKEPLIRVTFPEGFRVSNFLKFLPERYRDADTRSATVYEGFLFPDTYYFSPSMTIPQILTRMSQNFNEKTGQLESLFASSTLSRRDVVILASIVEREGRDQASMQIVASILRKRLAQNMPLQVDATFDYILGKKSSELTQSDLAIDSPYNTYTHRGLPPTPISNPGLIAIEAVLQPTSTPYLYYLTDANGIFHYATTFEEHKRNKALYLR